MTEDVRFEDSDYRDCLRREVGGNQTWSERPTAECDGVRLWGEGARGDDKVKSRWSASDLYRERNGTYSTATEC